MNRFRIQPRDGLSAGGSGETATRAFTLVELLAVIALLAVVLGIAVPAFRSMLLASERSQAENSLRVGVTVARDLAVRGDGDAALVIIRDADGTTRLVPVVQVGTILDSAENPFVTGVFDPAQDPSVERDVFAPIALATPFEMPRGWTVAGFADPNTIDAPLGNGSFDNWYDSEGYGDNGADADPTAADNPRLEGHWLLPETWMYEPLMQGPGAPPPSGYTPVVSGTDDTNRTPRQTFMVRFESGTGLLVRGERPALVVDPRPSALGRGLFPQEMRWARVDRAEDLQTWASRVLRTKDIDGNGATTGAAGVQDETFRVFTIGNFSNDTVLAGTVSRLATFREVDMADGMSSAGLNQLTRSLYLPLDFNGRISFDLDLFQRSTLIDEPADVRRGISRWIQGDTNSFLAEDWEHDPNGDGNVYGDPDDGTYPADQPRSLIFFVHPGTGELTEVRR